VGQVDPGAHPGPLSVYRHATMLTMRGTLASVAEAERTDGAGRRSGVWSGYGIGSAVLGLVAVAAVALVAVMWSGHRASAAERTHQSQVMQAAAEWTSVLINMNADNVEAAMVTLRDRTVGDLNTGFESSIAPYRDVVKTLRSRTQGQIESVSVEAVHNKLPPLPGQRPTPPSELQPGLVERTDTVLVVATSVSENAGGKPATVRWNLRLGVSDVGGKLMISRLESLR